MLIPATIRQMRIMIIAICCFVSMEKSLAETRLVFFPGVFYFDYVETTSNGTFLDGETGLVAGLSGQLEYQFSSQISGILHGGIYSGEVDYDGHASPSGTPVQTRTEANFFNIGAVGLFPIEGAALKTNFSIGYQLNRWERDIQSTVSPVIGYVSGLYEIYEWEELSMGMEIHLNERYSQQWSFYGGIVQTQDPRIKIDLESSGDGKPELNMGSDLGYEFSAQWMTQAKGSWYTGWKMSYKRWRFGKSNSLPISGSRTIVEPDSKTEIFMLELVIATSK